MPEKWWKKVERRVAKIMAGKRPMFLCPHCNTESPRYTRVPIPGRQRGATPDMEHDWCSLEMKALQNPPGYNKCHEAVDQAKASAHYGELPLAIFHKKGTAHGRDLVFTTLDEFTEWFGWIL